MRKISFIGKNNKARKRKSKKQPLWLRMLFFTKQLLINIPAFAAVSVLAFGIWYHQSGLYERSASKITEIFYDSSNFSGLTIKNILLEGQHYTPKQDILHAITTDEAGTPIIKIGSPLLEIDLQETKKRLESLTWVKFASVERQFPSTVSVSIVERKPSALWQYKGDIHLIGNDGQIIAEKDLERFSDLIILVGKDVPSYASGLIEMLKAEPEISKRVSSAIRVGERRWNVRLNNGIEIKLPEDNPEKAWASLARNNTETKILDSNITKIDLRIAERMVVR